MNLYRGDIPGFATRRTSKGLLVVEIDLEADPKKRDPLWQQAIRRKLPNDAFWRREFKRDWTVSTGSAYYPEFGLRASRYIHKLDKLIDGDIHRGWDFGMRHGACCWSQWSSKSNRMWVIRELKPEGLDTHSFANLVRYLSGQCSLDQLQKFTGAMRWLAWIEEEHAKDPVRMPKPPWFAPGHRFVDWAGHEAIQRTATIEGEHAARTDQQVLQQYGIYLEAIAMAPARRELVLRNLLHFRHDGMPGLLFDPACSILIAGFKGGIAYKKPTPQDPQPNVAAKDGYYEHLHDALGYVAANIVPTELDLMQDVENPDSDIEQIPLSENEGGYW